MCLFVCLLFLVVLLKREWRRKETGGRHDETNAAAKSGRYLPCQVKRRCRQRASLLLSISLSLNQPPSDQFPSLLLCFTPAKAQIEMTQDDLGASKVPTYLGRSLQQAYTHTHTNELLFLSRRVRKEAEAAIVDWWLWLTG